MLDVRMWNGFASANKHLQRNLAEASATSTRFIRPPYRAALYQWALAVAQLGYPANEKLKQEVQGLKSEIKAKDVEMDRLSLMSLTDNPVFDFSGRTYKKLKVIGKARQLYVSWSRESDKKFVVKQLMIPVENWLRNMDSPMRYVNLLPLI